MANYQEKQAIAHFEMWKRSHAFSLSYVYGSFSKAKQKAWDYCADLCKKYSGWSLKVINHNNHMFTAGFCFYDSELEVIRFMYITPHYDVIVGPVDY